MSNLTRGTVYNDNYVWDIDTLMWVRMTQPGAASVSSTGQLSDGVDTTIKATVKDYANSNPLTTVLVDTNGDPYVAGGSGGLTDTQLRASAVPVSVSGVATGAKQDTGNSSLASIDGKLPALGQALAAASVPIVLTAAQVSTLTPPAAITGYATTSKQDTGNTSLSSIDGKLTSPLTAKISDGTTIATVRELGTNDALNVAIADGSGNQITSFGGGTQYTEGDVDATITGNALLMEVAANTLQPVQGTVVDGLLVNLGANNDVTQNNNTATGNITALSQSVFVSCAGMGTAVIAISGTWVGTLTLTGVDGSGTQIALLGVNHVASSLQSSTTSNGWWIVPAAGWVQVGIVSTAWTSGTAAIAVVSSPGSDGVMLVRQLPAGTNNIGDIDVLTVNGVAPAFNTGARGATVQRVTIATDDVVPASQSGTWTVQPGNTANTTAWKVDGSAVTQPVSFTRLAGGTDTVTITPPTLTKGTQGATGLSTQDLKDAGRNQTNYFMAAPVSTTNAEAMQSLTGYKSGAAVGATVTPAVVTSGKTYRIQTITATIWAATAIGGYRFNLRANLSGSGVVGSPLVCSWQIGIPAVFTAGSAMTYTLPIPDGMEFAAGTGIAIGVIGEPADGTTATAIGKAMIAITGYEY